MPAGLDARLAMSLGTAGFTAALAIHRMEHNGQSPGRRALSQSPGPSGGVGSIAIDMLTARGYEVVAVTGKAQSAGLPYLARRSARVAARGARSRFEADGGGEALLAPSTMSAGTSSPGLRATVDFWGSIASIGLTGGFQLKTTVMPFILRGVNLLGINSSATPRDVRLKVWERIAGDLKPRHLERIVNRCIPFDDLPSAFDSYLKGEVTGRTIVRIGAK